MCYGTLDPNIESMKYIGLYKEFDQLMKVRMR